MTLDARTAAAVDELGAALVERFADLTRRLDGHDLWIGEHGIRIDDHEGRIAALERPTDSDPVSEFPIAWWAMSDESAVAAHAEAGFTHNVIWSLDVTVAYLDMLDMFGIKAIPFLQPEFVGHPAVVAAIVADEPDLMVGGVPKGSVESVANAADRVREMWPGLPVFTTMGSPCAAGPLSATEAESIDAGYWSLSTGPYNSPEGDERYLDYASHVDIVAPQMYTVAGNPEQPRYRRQEPRSTITAVEAGVRRSDFVGDGMIRAHRLLPDVDLWALLAPTKFATFGRKPTHDELFIEAQDAVDGGGKGIVYFDKGVVLDVPNEALTSDPEQLAIVTQVIAGLPTKGSP